MPFRCIGQVLLEQELSRQILVDGGHEERSVTYHLLMLDRLIELACSAITKDERPSWLSSIKAMAIWAKAVRLEGGFGPRLNDSAQDAAPPLMKLSLLPMVTPRSLSLLRSASSLIAGIGHTSKLFSRCFMSYSFNFTGCDRPASHWLDIS